MKIQIAGLPQGTYIEGVGHENQVIASKHKVKISLVKISGLSGEWVSITKESAAGQKRFQPTFIPAALCAITFDESTSFSADESGAVSVVTAKQAKPDGKVK